jgi:hypothetical protein
MKLDTLPFPFILLTPCFSGTAEGKTAQSAAMRVPPIRGHIRFWHRVLFGAESANRVWGSTAGEHGHASRVALRFSGEVEARQANPKPDILPHKPPGQRGPRVALGVGNEYSVTLQRLVGCSPGDWENAECAMKVWLILGSVGLRSNRAAGSVWPLADWVPTTHSVLAALLGQLRCPWEVRLAGPALGDNANSLREAASNTVSDAGYFGDVADKRRPGSRRHPSEIKFKVIRLDKKLRLLLTAPPSYPWEEARQALCAKPLASVAWERVFVAPPATVLPR